MIETFEPPHKLVMTWHVLYDDEMAAEPPGRVEWTLVPANGDGSVTRVTLRHGDLALSPKTWANVRLGWVGVLDGLKTLLETGEPMPAVDTSSSAPDDVEGGWHRTQGITANNSIWELLDERRHTPDEADELLSRAYASQYHWARAAGRKPINAARGAYMIGKAHTVLHQADMALRWSERYDVLLAAALDGAADFDHAYGLELRARALALAGRVDEASVARRSAIDTPIADADDRAIVEADLAAGPWFGIDEPEQ